MRGRGITFATLLLSGLLAAAPARAATKDIGVESTRPRVRIKIRNMIHLRMKRKLTRKAVVDSWASDFGELNRAASSVEP